MPTSSKTSTIRTGRRTSVPMSSADSVLVVSASPTLMPPHLLRRKPRSTRPIAPCRKLRRGSQARLEEDLDNRRGMSQSTAIEKGKECPKARALTLEQLVKSDWQLADTPTGRVEDCIGDSRAHTGNADLPDATRAHRRVWIGNVGPDHVNLGHVHVNRDMVFGEARVHDPAVTIVKLSFLHQSHPQPHDDAAAKLTPRGLGIDDAPGIEGA